MNTKLERAYNDAKEILDELNIPYGPIVDIRVNYRATSRWGMCSYRSSINGFIIEISSMLLEDGVSHDVLMDTMIHELLHAHKSRMRDGHKGSWKTCANVVNYYYPQYNIKRCTSAAEKGIDKYTGHRKELYKYEIVCDGCGYVDRYQRKSKIVKMILANPKHASCWCSFCKSHSFTVKTLDI